jgi:hypothetical protein
MFAFLFLKGFPIMDTPVTPPTDLEICNHVLIHLLPLFDLVASNVRTDPTKDPITLLTNVSKQLGDWVDRRQRVVKNSPPPAPEKDPAANMTPDEIEVALLQALEDIHEAQRLEKLNRSIPPITTPTPAGGLLRLPGANPAPGHPTLS